MNRLTPADAYIRCRIVREPNMPAEQLAEALLDERIYADVEHIVRLGERMRLPSGFRPHDLSHPASQAFLRRHGLWTMWQPHGGTREALALAAEVQPRTAVQTLITGAVEDDTIVKIAKDDLRVSLSASGLKEFRHFFWNTRLLSRLELAGYIREHLRDAELARIALLPPCETTALRAMAAAGVPPPAVDERKIVDSWLAMVSRLGAACATDLPPGPAQAAALKHHADTLIALREVRAELHRDDFSFEDGRYAPQTVDFPIPTLADLTSGRAVPFPVGSLTPPEAAEAVPTPATDGNAKPAAG